MHKTKNLCKGRKFKEQNRTKQLTNSKSVYVLGTKITILPLCQSKEHTTIGFLMKNPIEI